MDQAVLNNIIAIVGMLTGIAGFGLSLFVIFRDRVKLKVCHPDIDSSSLVAFNLEHAGQDEWGNEVSRATGHIVALWLQIANASNSPTTILEMALRIDDQESILHNKSPDYPLIAVSYSVDENDEIDIGSSRRLGGDIIKPVFKLEPYSAVEGYFVFTNLSYLSETEYKVQLAIRTTQRIIKTNFTIHPCYPKLIEQRTTDTPNTQR